MIKNLSKVISIIVVVVLLATSIASSALANATTRTFSTNFTLVNTGTQDATVHVEYILDTGVLWPGVTSTNVDFSVPGSGGQVQIRQYFDTTMQGGKGSAVVSSDQPLGSVIQMLARGQVPSSAAITGYSSGSQTIYLPNLAHNGGSSIGLQNAIITVQNTSIVNVDAHILLVPLSGYTDTFTQDALNLAPGQSYFYDLSNESRFTNPSWYGSAVVTATQTGSPSIPQSIVAVAEMFAGPDAHSAYNGFPASMLTSDWTIPYFSIRLGNGQSSVITMQNLSGSQMAINSVSLTCTKSANSPDPATFTVNNNLAIPDKSAFNFNAATNPTMFPFPSWYGACRLQAPGNVVVYDQIKVSGSAIDKSADSFQGIPTNTTGKVIYAPLIGKRLGNGFATVVTIQNMSYSATAHVDLYYTPNAVECTVPGCIEYHVGPLSIPPGSNIIRNHRLGLGAVNAEDVLPDSWVGSLKIVSSDQDINGFVQITYYKNVSGDTFMTHNMIIGQ